MKRSYNVVEKAEKKEKTEKKEKAEKKEKKTPAKAEKKAPAKAEKKEESMDEEDEEDPEPKRPLTSYMLFSQEHREEITKKYPDLKITDISAKITEQWKNLSEKEREAYKKRSDENRELYNTQMKEWRERHPDAKTRAEKKRERKANRACSAKVPTARALFAKERRAALLSENAGGFFV